MDIARPELVWQCWLVWSRSVTTSERLATNQLHDLAAGWSGLGTLLQVRLPSEEFATKDSELLACDVECRLAGIEGFYLELDIPELDELIGGDR